MASLIRKKKGNIILAILMFVIGLFVLIYGLFLGAPGYGQSALSLLAIGLDAKHFSELIKVFKITNINWSFLIIWVGPFVTSLLALILRRYRMINVINLLMFGLVIASHVMILLQAPGEFFGSYLSQLKSYVPILISHFVGFIFALVNTELCR